MTATQSLARVILRPDGSVHIAFRDVRAIYASAGNIMELFSDPIGFINTKSHTYKESTFEINRKRVSLEDVLGLTLAIVSADKQIICDFPELFQYIISNVQNDSERLRPLNMKAFELETVLSDEKSFLLRYYLEFTNHLTSSLVIKNNIRLRDEVQFEILREILNAFFGEELPEPAKETDVSQKIAQIESDNLLKDTAAHRWVSMNEYCKILNITPPTVAKYISQGRIKSAYKDAKGHWVFDRDEKPVEWDLRRGRKRKPSEEGKHYKRRHKGSAADVKEHIEKTHLFSSAIAPYIHTFEELNYYTKHHYREIILNNRNALVIDINPDYISSVTGLSNRERIKTGLAPVVPDRSRETEEYHLHHIGQHSTSPYAIIPGDEHNGKDGFSTIFHQGTPNEELHGAEHNNAKISFWRHYLRHYDEVGSYHAMHFLNSEQKKR